MKVGNGRRQGMISFKDFSNPYEFGQQPHGLGTPVISILKMRKLRLKRNKQLRLSR